MKSSSRIVVVLISLGGAALLVPEAAAAYGGPGSVITGLGALFAALAAVVAALFGFFWFPVKRLIRKVRDRGEVDLGEPAQVQEESVGR